MRKILWKNCTYTLYQNPFNNRGNIWEKELVLFPHNYDEGPAFYHNDLEELYAALKKYFDP